MPPECRDVAGRGAGVAGGKPRNQSGVWTRVWNIQHHASCWPRASWPHKRLRGCLLVLGLVRNVITTRAIPQPARPPRPLPAVGVLLVSRPP
jgi:hypothetical protein